jgi:hypothetical protein
VGEAVAEIIIRIRARGWWRRHCPPGIEVESPSGSNGIIPDNRRMRASLSSVAVRLVSRFTHSTRLGCVHHCRCCAVLSSTAKVRASLTTRIRRVSTPEIA